MTSEEINPETILKGKYNPSKVIALKWRANIKSVPSEIFSIMMFLLFRKFFTNTM